MDISISIMDDHPDQLSCEKATKYPGKNLKKKKIVKNLSRQKVVVSSQKQIETRNSKRKQNITKNQVSSWKCLKKKKKTQVNCTLIFVTLTKPRMHPKSGVK